jgi:hypothetical protein
MFSHARALALVSALLLLASAQVGTHPPRAPAITTPAQQFGASPGDDYFLATYSELEAYWQQLDRESDRMSLVDIGRTEEGRTQWMAIITAPENFTSLDRYKEISRRLAYAEGVTDAEARALAEEGKAVVWIDGGLHADEVLGAQQLIETVYQLVSRNDAETRRLLRDVIVLAVHANPDGHELVAGWYMREKNPRKRTLAGVPRLYQKYAGHDNNRDFYMATQAETINMNRILYREWLPQIVYNHHQADLDGAVMVAPPFRAPFNYVFDPLIPASIDQVGAAMHDRFAAEGKGGVTRRSGSVYSTWWNGGLRTTPYFHNQIGLLTETIGNPTPAATSGRSAEADRLAGIGWSGRVATRQWRFRQSIEYSVTANRAVLDIASRHRERWLYNIYRMGRNSIERGSRDSWTASPHRPIGRVPDPRLRDPRGYILPADQPDFLTATKFVNALLQAGVVVHRATADFSVNARRYPAGSYIVMTAQAFRPHVLDMFEPQDHPDDFPDGGSAPRPPYDSAGWTLAFQMGVKFDRVLDGFDGPFETMTGAATPPRGVVAAVHGAVGYLVSHHHNDAVIAINRLLDAGERVFWLRDRVRRPGPAASALRASASHAEAERRRVDPAGIDADTGMIYIAAGPSTAAILENAARDLGLTFTGVYTPPARDALRLRRARLGLVDRDGGWSSSGWIRWILERYEFPFEVVYPRLLDGGSLASRYDVLILPSEAGPTYGSGDITVAKTVPSLKRFVKEGGTLLAIGRAAALGTFLDLPVSDPLQRLPRDRYFVPGSVLRVAVDQATPLGYGFGKEVDVFFDNSPVFQLEPGAEASGIRPVAWFASAAPLRSGWAWGQAHLQGTVAVVDAPLGKGRVLLFGPEITFRAQPHGTFKFLFNGIYYGKAIPSLLY